MKKKIFILLALCFLFSGCGFHAYYKGMKHLDKGDYEQSVIYLNNAVQSSPENEKYKDGLAQAKIETSQFYYKKAKQYFDSALIGQAEECVIKALAYQPDSSESQSLSSEIKTRKSASKTLCIEALELAHSKKWDSAITNLKKMLELHKDYPSGEATLNKVKSEATDYYLSFANQRLSENDFNRAIGNAQAALKYSPGNRKAKKILQQVGTWSSALDYTDKGTKIVDSDPDKALSYFKKSKAMYPTQPNIDSYIKKAEKAIKVEGAKKMFSIAYNSFTEKDYEKSLTLLQQANDLDPQNQSVKDLLKKTRLCMMNDILSVSQKALGDGYPLVAMIYCLKANEICPNDQGIKASVQKVSARIKQKITPASTNLPITISVKGDSNNVSLPINNQELENAARQGISKVSKISIADSPAPQVDQFFLDIRVNDYYVKTEMNTYTQNHHYVSGTRNVPNPRYMELQNELTVAYQDYQQAATEYNRAMADYNRNMAMGQMQTPGSTGAKASGLAALGNLVGGMVSDSEMNACKRRVDSLKSSLSHTSSTVQENVYSDYAYPVKEYHRHGGYNVKVCFVKSKDILSEEFVSDSCNYTDKTYDGYPAVGLNSDPLNIKSEPEIAKELKTQMLSAVGEKATSMITSHFSNVLKNCQKNENQWEKWETGIKVGLQCPSIKNGVIDEIEKEVSFLPEDLINSFYQAL